MSGPPSVRGVIETALYTDDFDRAMAFYTGVLGLAELGRWPRGAALGAGERSVLLMFRRGESLHAGDVPPHDGHGPVHVAFAIDRAALEQWRERLGAAGVAIEHETRWPRGGHSLYFRDPDGHSLELVTPGTWPIY